MARRGRASPRRGQTPQPGAQGARHGAGQVVSQGGGQGGGLASVLEQLGNNLRGASPAAS